MWRKLFMAAGLILVAYFNTGCSLPIDPTGGLMGGEAGSITGRVVMGAAGKAVPKTSAITVSLDLLDRSVIAASDGSFRFDNCAAGAYAVTAAMGNEYKVRLPLVGVVPGQTTNVSTLELEAAGVVSGTVGLSGAALPAGINVALYGTDMAAVTSADGGFKLTGVPAGTYDLVIGLTGYATALIEELVVPSGAEKTVDPVTLIAKGTTVDICSLPVSGTDTIDLAVSPSGRYLAVSFGALGSARDLWLYDLDGDVWRALSATAGLSERSPAWSPRGTALLFQRGGNIYRYVLDGGAVGQLLADADDPVWSQNPERIMYERNGAVLSLNPADGSSSLILDAAFSPDVSRAGVVAVARTDGIWMCENDGSGAVRVVTTGTDPVWLYGPRELLYRQGTALVRYDFGTGYTSMITSSGVGAAYCRTLNRVFYWDPSAQKIRAYQM